MIFSTRYLTVSILTLLSTCSFADMAGDSSTFSAISFMDVQPPIPAVEFLNDIEFETKARIEFINEEGGFYGLITEEGDHLYPLNLPEIFENEGVDVYIYYRQANILSPIIWGEPIVISAIQ